LLWPSDQIVLNTFLTWSENWAAEIEDGGNFIKRREEKERQGEWEKKSWEEWDEKLSQEAQRRSVHGALLPDQQYCSAN